MSDFSCLCGRSQRDGTHPKDCEKCTECGSKIIALGEEFDEPLEHVIVTRIDDGRSFSQCKRCGMIN